MDNQLDISTAPGWLRRMWDRRQGGPVLYGDGWVTIDKSLAKTLENLANLPNIFRSAELLDDDDPWPEVPEWGD